MCVWLQLKPKQPKIPFNYVCLAATDGKTHKMSFDFVCFLEIESKRKPPQTQAHTENIHVRQPHATITKPPSIIICIYIYI